MYRVYARPCKKVGIGEIANDVTVYMTLEQVMGALTAIAELHVGVSNHPLTNSDWLPGI